MRGDLSRDFFWNVKLNVSVSGVDVSLVVLQTEYRMWHYKVEELIANFVPIRLFVVIL